MCPDPLPWIHWQRGDDDDQKKFAAYIQDPQNLNMYAHVTNNPLGHTDPTGMSAEADFPLHQLQKRNGHLCGCRSE